MASRTLVKNYLAQWMQMGKTISLINPNQQVSQVSIYKILQGDRYSSLFNNLWVEISTTKSEKAYLTGTDQTISDLLSNQWEIIACARCNLMMPTLDMGPRLPICCPCDDLPHHPNLDSISPHIPINLETHLSSLCDRLTQKSTDDEQESHNVTINDSDTNDLSDEEDRQTIQNLRTSILKLVKSYSSNPSPKKN